MVKAKTTDDTAHPTPGPGGNVTDATRRQFYKGALKAQQAIDEAAEILSAAKSVLKSILKNAKAEGIIPSAITNALKLRTMDKDDLILEQREHARFLALSGIWPSIQTDFFSALVPAPDLTAETTVDVAFDNGHTCGVKGENRDINPHVPATEQWEAWDRGWLQGQGSNVEKLGGRKRMTKKEQAAASAAAETQHEPADMPTEEPSALFDE